MTQNVVALTGAGGFLGWHTRAAARESGVLIRTFKTGAGFDPVAASKALHGSSRLVHIAGVNRGLDSDVEDGNLQFASQVANALRTLEHPPGTIVFANSTQVSSGSVYGTAKGAAAKILEKVASEIGADFVDVRLPNLFGEHGKPFYNAVTATFSHLLAVGQQPRIDRDRELCLLHAQDAADFLLGTVDIAAIDSLSAKRSVSELLLHLQSISHFYKKNEIPDISDKFSRDLFNTYRSYTIRSQTPIMIARHADERGSFFEIVRARGGSGQSSFSTTLPGISRGDHFHRRKVERFTVLSGEAVISLRRLFDNEVLEFRVTGSSPVAIDMPTMWAHKITNVGSSELYTSFWSNEIFDPGAPDTIAEAV